MNLPPITDGELKILEVLWEESPLPASQIAFRLGERVGWSKNTAYTFLTRLVTKGVIKRTNPGFLCRPLITRDAVGVSEGRSFLKRIHRGSLSMMVASFVNEKGISKEELAEIRQMVNDCKMDEAGEKA